MSDHPANYRPPEACLEGAIGWRNDTESDPERPGMWRVKSWTVVFSDHVTVVGLDGLAYCDSVLHPV